MNAVYKIKIESNLLIVYIVNRKYENALYKVNADSNDYVNISKFFHTMPKKTPQNLKQNYR